MAIAANRAGSASTRRLAYLASFLLFIVLCASIAYWAMQMFTPEARPVAPPPVAQAAPVDLDAAASLFGAKAEKTAVASNYQLKGLVLASRLADSVVILSRDGKPAEAFPAGREIAPGVKVKEVHPAYILLSENGVEKRVELPAELVKGSGAAGRTEAPVRTYSAAPARTPPSMAGASGTPAGASGQASQTPVQPAQPGVPPGTPVPAGQAPAMPSSGASAAGSQAAGAGGAASPAQGAVVVQSPPTAATSAGAVTPGTATPGTASPAAGAAPAIPMSGGAVTQAQQGQAGPAATAPAPAGQVR